MRELPDLEQVRAAWLNQPGEETRVDVEDIEARRTREIFSTTRSEIIGSLGAALFFALVMAWRFAPEHDRLAQYGCVGVIVWAVLTAWRYRRSIWRETRAPDSFARTGLEHYRAELLRRRDHLRSRWIWHGPLLLACTVAAAVLSRRIVPGRVWHALPAVVLLAGWAVIGIKRRLREAAEVQREIEELRKEPTL